ncbi:MAG: SUMF1/EgtB/PvdO family nonheme iron enzyme [Bacteroidales bacterium]|nr:SUMF1/EgtB/PvdO family nonheme iron enzyme [Bacteroidales bacterium]
MQGVSFKMIKVHGGSFQMGATPDQGANCSDSEKPPHEVLLNDYYIGETEVTQELWQAVMGDNPSGFLGGNLPVECVPWDDCNTFISNLNALSNRKFSMPTEAQWEYAARGGNRSRGFRYSGSNDVDEVSWYTENSYGSTHPVKTKSPNELGIYDMSGNVWEWCSDWYGYYSLAGRDNPTGPSNGTYRVLRGGSWYNCANESRVSYRNYNNPIAVLNGYGLRVVLSR